MKELKQKFNTSSKSLRDKTIVFTGELQEVTRRQASAIAYELDGIVKKTVTAGTDLVVAGKDAGKKLQQAAAKGVRIISEQDFWAVVKKQRAADKRAAAPKPQQQPGV